MNKVILMGRLVRDPNMMNKVAKWILAVDRKVKRDGTEEADFIGCTAFGKTAEFAEKYLKQGIKILVTGRIQTGSYEKSGTKVYTTDVIVEEIEFAESKKAASNTNTSDEYMNIPDDVNEELPFN